MDNGYISRQEHSEFVKRMEDEHSRQNHRIGELEETVRQIGELTISVKEMAVSMKSMLVEQKSQGDRLEALESRDGEKWRKAVGYAVTAIIGGVIGFFLKQMGM